MDKTVLDKKSMLLALVKRSEYYWRQNNVFKNHTEQNETHIMITTYNKPSPVKNQYKQDVIGNMVIFGYLRNSYLCQFIEIFNKIINWYMKDAK